MPSRNVIVLASCGGGNFEALVKKSKELNYNVSKLIVNCECTAIEKAINFGITCAKIYKKGQDLFEGIDREIPEDTGVIVLAGFLPIIPAWFCEKWNGRLINIHPSLLPAYGGKGMYGVHVQEAVMEAREEYAGCTVHYVNAGIDTGDIIEQRKIKVDYSLTPWELGGLVYEEGTKLLPVVVSKLLNR